MVPVKERKNLDSNSIQMESSDKEKSKLFPIFQKNFKTNSEKVSQLKSLRMAMEKAASPQTGKRKKAMFPKRESEGMTQMILDAGQKEIGPRYCNECGMLYSPGEAVDEDTHRQAHLRLKSLTSLKLWKDVNVLQSYIDGGQVIMVQTHSAAWNVKNNLRNLLAWVDSEVGGGGGGDEVPSSQRIFLYVYPSTRKNIVRVFGCAVTELIEPNKVSAFRLLQPNPPQIDGEEGIPKKPNPNIPAVIWVGITRLWTDKDFRRRKIASRLCDMILTHSGIIGCLVPKERLGILEPSEDGRAFMYKYSEGKGALYSSFV